MKAVTMYEAEDGKHFRYEDDCLRHERKCANKDAANELLASGGSLFDALSMLHENGLCARLSEGDKEQLRKMTKDTAFVVSHWQCQDTPGYKPQDIDLDGRVYLYGDAGSWSGSYGGWVNVYDLLRYAQHPMHNANVTGPRLRGSGGQQGSTALEPSSGD